MKDEQIKTRICELLMDGDTTFGEIRDRVSNLCSARRAFEYLHELEKSGCVAKRLDNHGYRKAIYSVQRTRKVSR